MEKVRVRGFGVWDQCSDCGATFHNDLWWLGGFKSKVEPPCTIIGISSDWLDTAVMITDEDC